MVRCQGVTLLMCFALSAMAQPTQQPDVAEAVTCGCQEVLDAVVRAVETDYAGFQLKIDAKRREAYERFTAVLRSDASRASAASCKEVLDLYTAFFQDHHLFVLRSGKTPGQAVRSSRSWTEAKTRAEIDRRRGNLDPVEGVWRSRQGRFAVLHEPGQPAGTFTAVALATNGAPSAEVAAELRRGESGSYLIRHRDANGLWQTTQASLHRGGAMLEFANQGWARVHPVIADARLDANDPQAPVFTRLDSETLYLSLPSFDPRYAQPLQGIVASHGQELEQARGFIIDLRANAGGNAIFYPLARFVLSGPFRASEDSSILASENNLETLQAMRDALGQRGSVFDPALQRMRQNPGRLVPYLDGEIYTPTPAEIAPGPKRVVLLVDRGVGSAAEAMVILARQSSRVIVVGENTRGNIDYQQVSLAPLTCGTEAYLLGTPLYTRTRTLPAGGLDVVGITPDVPVPTNGVDAVAFARRLLAQ